MKPPRLMIPLLVIFSMVGLFAAPAAGQNQVTLQLNSQNQDVWGDDQWVVYSVLVNPKATFSLNFTYSGDLDVDARLYMEGGVEGKRPWDVTHEGIEKFTPDDNSQFRGNGGLEEVRFYNELDDIAQSVFVVIFVFSGTGSSNLVVKSNIALTKETPPFGGFLGWVIDNLFLVIAMFGVALGGLIAMMVHFRRKYRKYIEAQKDATAKEKLGKSL